MSIAPKPDLVARAHASWGNPPEWVIAVAEAAMQTSQSAVARQVGYSPAVLSQTISNAYSGDMAAVEQRVRGALLKEKVRCPALVEVTRDECMNWQKKPFAATSGLRVKMYRACRSGCPNSRLQQEY